MPKFDKINEIYEVKDTEAQNNIQNLEQKVNALTTSVNASLTNLQTSIDTINDNLMYIQQDISKNTLMSKINYTNDIIDGYPTAFTTVLSASTGTTNNDRLSAQGFCTNKKHDNMIPTEAFMIAIKADESASILYRFKIQNTEWKYLRGVIYREELGHANDITYFNNALYVANASKNGVINKIPVTSSGFGSVSEIKINGIDNPITGISFDVVKEKMYVAYFPTIYEISTTSWSVIKTHTITGGERIVGQGIDVHDGLLYKVRTALNNYGDFETAAIYSTSYLYVHDLVKNKLLKIHRFNDTGEVESVSVNGDGYIMYNQNGYGEGLRQCKMNAILEFPLTDSALDIFRTPISRRSAYFGKNYVSNVIYYNNSGQNSNTIAYGVGLGSQTNPYRSLLAVSCAIRDIDSTAPKSISVNIAGSISHPYDRSLSLNSIQSSITIIGDISRNSIGAITIRSSNRVRLLNVYVAPGATYYTDNNFLTEFGALGIQYSTVEIDGASISGGNLGNSLKAIFSRLRFRGTENYYNGAFLIDACQIAVNTKPNIGETAPKTLIHNVGDNVV